MLIQDSTMGTRCPGCLAIREKWPGGVTGNKLTAQVRKHDLVAFRTANGRCWRIASVLEVKARRQALVVDSRTFHIHLLIDKLTLSTAFPADECMLDLSVGHTNPLPRKLRDCEWPSGEAYALNQLLSKLVFRDLRSEPIGQDANAESTTVCASRSILCKCSSPIKLSAYIL